MAKSAYEKGDRVEVGRGHTLTGQYGVVTKDQQSIFEAVNVRMDDGLLTCIGGEWLFWVEDEAKVSNSYEITALDVHTDDDGEVVSCEPADILMAFPTTNDKAAVYIFDKFCAAKTPNGYQEYEADYEPKMGDWTLIATRENPEGGGYALWR